MKKIERIKDKAGVVNANSFTATLAIAPDCMLGNHALRVCTAGGVSNMPIVFSVGALDVVEEKEPNSEFASPQAIAMNVTVTGAVQNEDVDYFVIEAKKGSAFPPKWKAFALCAVSSILIRRSWIWIVSYRPQ